MTPPRSPGPCGWLARSAWLASSRSPCWRPCGRSCPMQGSVEARWWPSKGPPPPRWPWPWRPVPLPPAPGWGSWACPRSGWTAAAELGVDLSRLVLVAPPSPGEWATVAATLVDAFDVVLAGPPRRGAVGMARRLQAAVRERGAVLCTVRASGGTEPDLTLTATTVGWEGLEPGAGHLQARRVVVQATGRRAAAQPRRATLLAARRTRRRWRVDAPAAGGGAAAPGGLSGPTAPARRRVVARVAGGRGGRARRSAGGRPPRQPGAGRLAGRPSGRGAGGSATPGSPGRLPEPGGARARPCSRCTGLRARPPGAGGDHPVVGGGPARGLSLRHPGALALLRG